MDLRQQKQNTSDTTLQLLAQYNDHISQRDKTIEDIEGTSNESSEDSELTHDELFKENVRLTLQLKRQETELKDLQRVIEALTKRNQSFENNSGPSGEASYSHSHGHSDSVSSAHTHVYTHSRSKSTSISSNHTLTQPNVQSTSHSKSISNASSLSTPVAPARSTQRRMSRGHSRSNTNDSKISNKTPSTNNNAITTSGGSFIELDEDLNSAPQISISSDTDSHSQIPHMTTKQTILAPDDPLSTTNSTTTTTTNVDNLLSPSRSPQNSNRYTSVINNHLHSPLSINYNSDTNPNSIDNNHIGNFNDSPKIEDILNSPISNINIKRKSLSRANSHSKLDTNSPKNSNLQLDTRRKSISGTTVDLSPISSPIRKIPPPSSPIRRTSSATSDTKLGSPAKIKQTSDLQMTSNDAESPTKKSSHYKLQPKELINDLELKTMKSIDSLSNHSLSIATTAINTTASTLQIPANKLKTRVHSSSISSTKSKSVSAKSDAPLYVHPEEFDSIRVETTSTLFITSDSISSSSSSSTLSASNNTQPGNISPTTTESSTLLSVIDKKRGTLMFECSKSLKKLIQLNDYLKTHLMGSNIPSIPNRCLFNTTMPTKVDIRREELNKFFSNLLAIQSMPTQVGLFIAKFLSTDIIQKTPIFKNSLKEGSLILRRPKAIGSAVNWRLRYGNLHGNLLELYEKDQLTETIILKNCTLELIPNIPEDKHGTKNGFLLSEHKKAGLTNTSKYFICTETPRERESWVTHISQIIDHGSNYHSTNTSRENSNSISKPQQLTITSGITNPNIEHTNQQLQSQKFASKDSSRHNLTDMNEINSQQDTQLEDSKAELDRDNKRNKMRSLFIFKKLGQSGDDVENEPLPNIEHDHRSINMQKSFSSSGTAGSNSSENVIFGAPLERALQTSSNLYQGIYKIPSVVYRCLEYLYKNRAVSEQGIFRLSGSSSLMKSLQEQFELKHDIDLYNYNEHLEQEHKNTPSTCIDIHTVSGLLKLYFRTLPHSIFGDDNYKTFLHAAEENPKNPAQVALNFQQIIGSGQIHKDYISLMYSLFELLLRINKNKDINKMSIKNICIVFSPTLNIPINILQPLIVDFDCIFNKKEPIDDSLRDIVDVHIPHA
ncbi:hypothetical protein TBLA_0E04070 [Henningerozyma blattae CBS 6284]|uniref:Rho-GAP domain-containing protein n=1 Tax=Henningerozyma blattae (strain ATCC 34711 / CBS 6284 / DSM 70876 / NBRC 10599 / NRRL Y-10934 / UCD 77-7) TaxID=1071380 RepID=I2H510_HENB6|nr:hypothetical protein TBLA_0E04070 [Tetrapisispora blattae CBS 6284]CCH61462.1 hypothetical protein TBLA_0E04070 [Tetrapisispora blattae CBS 6284]